MEERKHTPPDDYSSFVFRGLLEGLASPPKRQILDLGPASGPNIDWLCRYRCKVFIANFFERLSEDGPRARQDAASFGESCRQLLDFPPEARFDLVLLWDLLNYLSLAEVEVLMQHLRSHCHRGTRMMALVSIYQKIPDRPFRFLVLSPDEIRYETSSRGLRESPRHREIDLLRRMAGFEVEKAMLLRNGMREYAFILDSAAVAADGN